MTVDETVLNEKIQAGKPLSKEEAEVVLRDEGPVEGYMKSDVEDMSPEEFDNKEETKEGVEEVAAEDKDETKEGKDETKPATTETKTKKDETPKPAAKEDTFVKLERELAKEEGKEDLKEFSDREKAYFHQMRRDRKRAQKAEADLDTERRERLKLKTDLETTKKAKEEAKPDPIEELKKKDPTDYLTVAEVIGLVQTLQTKPAESKKEDREDDQPQVDHRQMRYLKMCEKEARETHPEDFDAVMELTEDIIMNNPKHLNAVAQATKAGENPAIKAYELIKADPEFATLYQVAKTKIEARGQMKKPEEKKVEKKEEKPTKTQAEIDKEKRVKASEEAMEKNKNKTKTTGHVETAGLDDDDDSLSKYADLPDREFAKLPKKTRQKVLDWMKEV